jgi:hypothetical protein
MGHVLERSDRGSVHRAMRGRSSQSTCFYAFRIDSSSAFRCNMLPGVQLCSTYPFLIAAHIHTLICFWVSEVLTFVLRTFSFMEGSALFLVAHAENATLLIPPSFRFYSLKKVSACSARKVFRVIWSGNEKNHMHLLIGFPLRGSFRTRLNAGTAIMKWRVNGNLRRDFVAVRRTAENSRLPWLLFHLIPH